MNAKKQQKRERLSVQLVPSVAELKARCEALGLNFSEIVNECLEAVGGEVFQRKLGEHSKAVAAELEKLKRAK